MPVKGIKHPQMVCNTYHSLSGITFFLPDFMSCEENVSSGNDLFSFLKLTVGTRETLSHRDYLGSLMSIGKKGRKLEIFL
jgi:hypothetical protein